MIIMENKHRSVFEHCRLIIKDVIEWYPMMIFWWGLEVVLEAAEPFMFLLVPSLIIRLLTKGTNIEELTAYIGILFLFLAILRFIKTAVIGRNSNYYINLRLAGPLKKLYRSYISRDYEEVEPNYWQKQFSYANESLYTNARGYEGFTRQLIDTAKNTTAIFLFSMVVGRINVYILILLLILSVLQSIAYRWAVKYEMKNQFIRADLLSKTWSFYDQMTDVAAGKDIRLYQMQNWLNGKNAKIVEDYERILIKEKKRFYLVDLIGQCLQLLRDGGCYLYLIVSIMHGKLSVDEFVLYISMVSGFSIYFLRIVDNLNKLNTFAKQIDPLRDYLESSAVNESESNKIDQNEIEIELEHVDFIYPQSDKKILNDFSLKIKNKEKIALVGINGAGKTTLVKLLCGLYKPTTGTIQINGINIEELSKGSIFNAITAVFQESYIFPYEIYQNVSLNEMNETDMEKVIECCQKVGLHEKIKSFSKGYETLVGKDLDDSGIQFSGGEKQKLLLARALYQGGDFMILDEPTAQLDAISESELYEDFKDMTYDKTALFISHRLASTRFCDRILFLENGKIIEEGTHDELMQLKGKYQKMFEVQSQYYREENVNEAKD